MLIIIISTEEREIEEIETTAYALQYNWRKSSQDWD
jgi:hypothetical protein